MQQRHTDREVYFHELAQTSERYFIPYVERVVTLSSSARVLEVGCGEGGNLVPFARRGCAVTGVDRAAVRVAEAQSFFSAAGLEGHFEAADIFNWAAPAAAYDVILLHDVVEHVPDKAGLLCILRRLIRPGGVLFVGFPSWFMPFGGHQQIARNAFVAHCPFLHLLPLPCYAGLLRRFETPACVTELLSIRACRCTVRRFEREALLAGWTVADRQLWWVNPHYEQKFGLRPRLMPAWWARLPLVRDMTATACFCLLQ